MHHANIATMDDNIFDARLGIIDTIRGILMDLAESDEPNESARLDMMESLGDVANLILEVLNLEIIGYDEESGQVTATLDLAPIS